MILESLTAGKLDIKTITAELPERRINFNIAQDLPVSFWENYNVSSGLLDANARAIFLSRLQTNVKPLEPSPDLLLSLTDNLLKLSIHSKDINNISKVSAVSALGIERAFSLKLVQPNTTFTEPYREVFAMFYLPATSGYINIHNLRKIAMYSVIFADPNVQLRIYNREPEIRDDIQKAIAIKEKFGFESSSDVLDPIAAYRILFPQEPPLASRTSNFMQTVREEAFSSINEFNFKTAALGFDYAVICADLLSVDEGGLHLAFNTPKKQPEGIPLERKF